MEDKTIIQEFKQGVNREKQFEMLLAKYQKKTYWYIRTMVVNHDDADDVTQTTFVKVWKYLDTFQEKSSFSTWLYRIATNECLTFLNKNKCQVKMKDFNTVHSLAEKIESQDGYDTKSIEWQLQKAIHQLPEKQKIVFLFRYYQDLPFKEISSIMDISENSLKSSYRNAMIKVKKYLLNNAP